jgi:hypothetical protein
MYTQRSAFIIGQSGVVGVCPEIGRLQKNIGGFPVWLLYGYFLRHVFDKLKKVESGSYQQRPKIEHIDFTIDFIGRTACWRDKKRPF